jgi:hypothetical protein
MMKQALDLGQRKAQVLRDLDERQPLKNARVILTPTIDPPRGRQQIDLLIIANCRCANAGALGNLADRQ